MQNQTKTDPIKIQIQLLEAKQSLQLVELKEQMELTFDQLKPLNLIKSTLNEMTRSPEIKSHLLQGIIAVAGGYLSKKLIVGGSTNILKQIGGTLLQFFVTKKIVQTENELIGEEETTVQN